MSSDSGDKTNTPSKRNASTDAVAGAASKSSGGKFPDEVVAAARASHEKWGVPASVSLAQWALESSFGSRMPAGSNNPFGMKARPGDSAVSSETREVVNGKTIVVTAQFRKFTSLEEAFDQHARLLATAHAYAKAMKVKDNPEQFADALTGVYATDPDYGSKLKKLIKTYNLTQYDVH